MKNKIRIIMLTAGIILLIGCSDGEAAIEEEEEKFLHILQENQILGTYINYVFINEEDSNEEAYYPYTIAVDATKSFYDLTHEQKHFILKKTSEEIANHIPEKVKTIGGHMECTGKTPCTFTEISFTYIEGEYGNEDYLSELYTIDFIESTTDTSEMTIFNPNNEENFGFESIYGVQEVN